MKVLQRKSVLLQVVLALARRSQCKNNLKQIGLALHNYNDVKQQFPPAGVGGTAGRHADASVDDDIANGTAARNIYIGWQALLLPYIDQDPLFKKINHNAVNMTANNAIWATFIPGLTCPSDSSATLGNICTARGSTMQRGSYGVNGGNSGFRTIWTVQYSTLSSTQRGLTGCGGGARIAEVKDGTANTVAALEIRSGLTASDVRGVWAYPPGSTVWGPGGINNGTDEYQDCTTQPAIGMPCITANNNAGLQVSRSEHRGGVHALMIDGAVRFLNQTISGTVYDNLRAIRDGNVVGEF